MMTSEHISAGVTHLLGDARRIALIALPSLVLSLALLWGIAQYTGSRVRHEREVARIARQTEILASQRQGVLRNYRRTRSDSLVGRAAAIQARLASKLDSLTHLTRDNAVQHKRALAIDTAVKAWESGYAQPLRAGLVVTGAGPDATTRDEALFARIEAAADDFVTAEDALYRTWAQRADRANLLLFVAILVELLAVGWAMQYLFAKSKGQSRELIEQQSSLEQQVEELQVLTEDLEAKHQELYEEAASRERAEVARSEADSLLQFVLGTAPVGIALHDGTATFRSVNEAFAQITGLPVNAHTSVSLDALRPDVARRLAPAVRRVCETGTPEIDIPLESAPGSPSARSWLCSIYPLSDQECATAGVGLVTVETTERRELEHQLLQSQKMEAVGRLAGGVAHDFNNLLTVILSYGMMARDQLSPEDPLRTDMIEIIESAQRAAGLTKQLLAFSRKQVLQPHLLNLNDVVSDSDRMLRRLIGEDIELVVVLNRDVGPVYADKAQLEQILMNLVVNARDAMPDGGRIIVQTMEQDLETEHTGRRIGVPPGRYVMLAVSDTGTGMSPETLTHLFEPFFTTKPPGEGTGLGLSTVYGIVKQSGGDLWVYSELGHGTTIKIFFPLATPEQSRRKTPQSMHAVRAGTETILLAEDDSSLRVLNERVLRAAGYRVLTAANGPEALEVARSHDGTIDMVATDVVMPQMNGRTLVDQVAESRPGTKVLFMSGYTDDDVMRRGVYQADVVFLQKPFTPEQLRMKVREVLDA